MLKMGGWGLGVGEGQQFCGRSWGKVGFCGRVEAGEGWTEEWAGKGVGEGRLDVEEVAGCRRDGEGFGVVGLWEELGQA